MPDAFAVLDLPRGPWLDAELLKTEFHRRSAAEHPDVGGESSRFADLNAAYRTLRNPVARLHHLLELENPGALKHAPQVPPSLVDEFMRIAAIRQTAEATLARWRAAKSSLARATVAGELAQSRQNLEAAISRVSAVNDRALAQMNDLYASWREHLDTLAALYAELSYLQKWMQQLREMFLQFDLARDPQR
jgi:curved DNA-binding protein CbpA